MSSSREVASSARDASRILSTLKVSQRTRALTTLHTLLLEERSSILRENAKDLDAARQADLSTSLISRLDLSKPGKYEEMAKGVLEVAELPDLLGYCTLKRRLDNNLVLRKVYCPIGVLLVIFEARPEVIINITALALKSGNAAILKGGKESTCSFRALAAVVKRALQDANIPEASISLAESREDVSGLLKQEEFIDLVIPRGSNTLVKNIKNNTKINVMGHADGICHVYLDKQHDLKSAISVILDSKLDYPAACNALESLLVHESCLESCQELVNIFTGLQMICKVEPSLLAKLEPVDLYLQKATDEDFEMEHLSSSISIRTVPSLQAAIQWINAHGSHHTDAILTTNPEAAKEFQRGVDSASVFVNASTRFADGMRYGLGTEVGIATGKIHARGPVGLDGIMTYKWLLDGIDHRAEDYGVKGKQSFKHENMPVVESDHC